MPTFNLNGDRKGAEVLLEAAIPDRRFVGKNVCHTLLYDRALHATMPAAEPGQAGDQCSSRPAWRRTCEHHEEKKWHDPTAAACHLHPEIGTWVRGRVKRIEGGWGTVADEGATWSWPTLIATPSGAASATGGKPRAVEGDTEAEVRLLGPDHHFWRLVGHSASLCEGSSTSTIADAYCMCEPTRGRRGRHPCWSSRQDGLTMNPDSVLRVLLTCCILSAKHDAPPAAGGRRAGPGGRWR